MRYNLLITNPFQISRQMFVYRSADSNGQQDASWLNVGESNDSSIPTGDMTLSGYDRVDVTATFKPSVKMSILLSVDNLLDEDFQEAIGFPSTGTRARLGLRYRF